MITKQMENHKYRHNKINILFCNVCGFCRYKGRFKFFFLYLSHSTMNYVYSFIIYTYTYYSTESLGGYDPI